MFTSRKSKTHFFCGLQLVLFLLRFIITVFYSKVLHIVSLSYKKHFSSVIILCSSIVWLSFLILCLLGATFFPISCIHDIHGLFFLKITSNFFTTALMFVLFFSSDSSHPNPSFFFFFFLMFIYSRVWTTNFPCSQPKTAEHFAKCLSNSTFGNETVSLSYIRILISKMS